MSVTKEDSLWLLLAGSVPLLIPSIDDGVWHWEAWMHLGSSIGALFFLDLFASSSGSSPMSFVTPEPSATRERRAVKNDPRKDELGVAMSIVMVPVLLRLLAHHHSRTGNPQARSWTTYAKIATLLVIPTRNPMTIGSGICVLAALLDPSIELTTSVLLVVVWFLLLPRIVTTKFASSFTFGELKVVCLLLLVAFTEYARVMVAALQKSHRNTPELKDNLGHPSVISSLCPLVTLSGSLSCFAFTYLSSNLRGRLSWWLRVCLNVVGPLLFVDLSLYVSAYAATTTKDFSSSGFYDYHKFVPLLCIQWLIEFLMEEENGYERFWGLLYWIGVLAVSSYPTYALLTVAASTNDNNKRKPSVVVTRKWFHLVAVFLFGPVTWQFPQLMTLSYAVASCILVVLEEMRSDAPLLQAFYFAFLDDRKDVGDQMIVSHLFLIVGCAAPLWIGQILGTTSLPPSSLSLLGQFGIICIGIGDAMGAVIGKTWGKRKWGRNQRTLEGSLAMWCSMTGVGIIVCCTSARECWALLVATIFTTILEAFTVQLDNLVLPLFGSCVILLILAAF